MKNKSPLFYIIPILILTIVASWGYYRIIDHYLIVDEKAHYSQTKMLADGNWKIYIKEGEKYPRNAMFPGYHFILSRISLLFGKCTPGVIRTILVLQSLLVVFLAYINLRIFIEPKKALICAMQVYFLPILFPFLFLIYTDSMAVSAILAALFFCIKRKYLWSAIFAFLTIFIRHNYIVLIPFFIIYPYIDQFGYKLTLENLKEQTSRSIPFLIPFTAFATFIIINRGRLTLDDPTSHIPTISIGNIIFAVFSLGLIFFPLLIKNRQTTSKWAKNHSLNTGFILLILAIVIILFQLKHPWNNFPWLLRNEILAWLLRDFMTRTVFFAIIAITVFSIIAINMENKASYMIYPFTVIQLTPILLIEPRYYIIPFILFNIFRKKMDYKDEVILLSYMIILAILIHNLHTTTAYVL